MSLLRFCRLITSPQISRFPRSLSLILLDHTKNKAHVLSWTGCRRTLFTNNCLRQSAGKNVRGEHLAVSQPRLHRKFEADRARDNLSRDYELIFSLTGYHRKLNFTHWFSFLTLAALPFIAFLFIWHGQDDEDVIFLGITIRQTTEYAMFLMINLYIMSSLFRNVRNVPLRIYFNEAKQQYVAISPSVFPWKTMRTEFKSTDIKDTPMKKLFPVSVKPWRHNEFLISKRVLIIPHLGFRSGHDRSWLLRHVNWQENAKNRS